MSVSLKKGQKISLTKTSTGLRSVMVGLGWDMAVKMGGLFSRKSKDIDCDASVLLLQNGKLVHKKDVVYFGNLEHESHTVQHQGDNLTGAGDGDDEQIMIHLESVPAVYDRLVVVVNIFKASERRQHFGMIKNAFIRIVDLQSKQELCHYNLSENYDGMTAMVFGEIYRRDGEWKFNAIGQGTKDTSLTQLIQRYQ